MSKKTEKMDKLEAIIQEKNSEIESIRKRFNEENEKLRGKLQFMEMNGKMESRASNIGGISKAPSTMTQMTGSNFGMEDEAGEEFNNTYLSDLKKGDSLQSFDNFDKYSTKELQNRNSMVPHHLRGSYAIVNLDRSASEQEMKVSLIIESKLFTFLITFTCRMEDCSMIVKLPC